jgi:hypothetical protein
MGLNPQVNSPLMRRPRDPPPIGSIKQSLAATHTRPSKTDHGLVALCFVSGLTLASGPPPEWVPEGFEANSYHNNYFDDIGTDFDIDDHSVMLFSVLCVHVLCISMYFCVCLF